MNSGETLALAQYSNFCVLEVRLTTMQGDGCEHLTSLEPAMLEVLCIEIQ